MENIASRMQFSANGKMKVLKGVDERGRQIELIGNFRYRLPRQKASSKLLALDEVS